MDGNETGNAKLTVADPSSDPLSISGSAAKSWEDSPLTGHVAHRRAPQLTNRKTQLLAPIVWVWPGSWGSSQGSSLRKERPSRRTTPTPSPKCGAKTPSLMCGRGRRATNHPYGTLILPGPATIWENRSVRSPDANSSWRQPAPGSRNERHALTQERRSKPNGRRRRRARMKPPPPGEALQMDPSRVKIRPKTALLNSSVRRGASRLGARRHARPDELRQEGGGGRRSNGSEGHQTEPCVMAARGAVFSPAAKFHRRSSALYILFACRM
ncbi:putative acid phosphatase [Trypanosoma cruzi]|nr:putative acid phosphatase [Trypanosoma cruzi]